jgi:hypothetical protein
MMVFATLGLILSYSIYYFLHSRYPRAFDVKPFNYVPKVHIVKTAVSLGLVAMSVIGLTFIRPNLNMNQFNFQTKSTEDNLLWLYSLINKQMPLFSVHERDSDMFKTAEAQTAWARDNGIALTNFSQFIPDIATQHVHLKSWSDLCRRFSWNEDDKKLFSHFYKSWACGDSREFMYGDPTPPYLTDIMSKDKWLTIWLPKTPEQIAAIQSYDTKSYSLGEVVQLFPQTLGRELIWMLPLSLGPCLLLLIWYFKQLAPSLVSLIPFLSGVGLYFTCVVVLGWHFSFISIISLIMVFGFSIDYGIFAVNLYILKNPPEARGVWTCLLFAALVTLLGFFPLAICHHPVLIHLGQTLVAGTIGTLIGTVWGIPGIFALAGTERGTT